MTFGQQVRVAGAVIVIASAFLQSLLLNFIGLIVMAIGLVLQVDNLENRITKLEFKGEDDETKA